MLTAIEEKLASLAKTDGETVDTRLHKELAEIAAEIGKSTRKLAREQAKVDDAANFLKQLTDKSPTND